MASNKEAIALVLDVSPSMENAAPGTSSPLQKSLTAINMIIQRKIFSKSKDEIALIAFGTAETNNQLASEHGGYDHITVVHELGPPDTELLQTVNNNIEAGPNYADFLDAVVVAVDHLVNKTSGRKMDARVVLFSDLSSEFGTDKLDLITKSMNERKVQLTFIGPEIPEDDDENSNHDDNDASRRQNQNANNHEPKPLSSQQLEGINCIKGILEQVDGEGMSFAEVLPMLSFFQTRSVKQTTTFRGPLEIGNTVKINVYGYVKVKESKPSSWAKVSALSEISKNPGSMKVTMQRSSHLKDEDFTEVEEENVAKAYRYGKTLVPYSKMDEKSLKLETERCLKILGFTDRRNVNPNQYQGESVYMIVPQPGDKDAAVALSALVHALEEKDMVAIVRYCRCKNAAPKLAFLTPVIKLEHEGFYMFALPFSEDIRRYPFASLDNINNTDEQLNAVDALIDGMDLTRAQRDENGNFVEAFKPSKTLNPTIQRQCQCVQFRALNPDDESLPEIEEYIKRSTRPLPEQAANCVPTVNKIKELFPLKPVEKKGNGAASNVFKESEKRNEPEQKKAKLSQNNEADRGFSFSSVARENITEVGTANPVSDYQTLVLNANSATFREVSSQLMERIMQLVNDSFLDQYYRKALECLKALRKGCLERSEPEIWNKFLSEIKRTMMGQRRNEFWELIKSENVGLISSEENSSSSVTDQEAVKFFGAKEEEKKEEKIAENEDDVDDLLDMM